MMWRNRKVLILGFSVTGISSAKYLSSQGARCFLSEYCEKENFDLEKIREIEALGVRTEFGMHSEEFMEGAEIAIVSPGISRETNVIKKLEELKIECITDIELAYRVEGGKMLAITGTNGKTTSTILASHVLSSEYSAPYCGNIGISPCDYLNSDASYLATEVSSFQLEYSPTFAPKIAIYTNFTPDHISWHGSEEFYFEAKAKMFRRMDETCHAILNYDDKRVRELSGELKCKVHFFSLYTKQKAYVQDGAIFYEDEKIVDIDELQILGPHNVKNAMGVIIMAKIIGLDTSVIKDAIKTFKAPPHRCEFICEAQGVSFYNDSKATNPEASIVAMNSFVDKKVCLIAGGRDKNTSLEEFCNVAKGNVDSVVLIGEAKERFREALLKGGYTNILEAGTLEDAIEKSISQKPDVVLFSPACASFDMFKNYEQRGEAFRAYVLSKR